MVGLAKLSTRLLAATKAIWRGGSPFTAVTAMWPTNDEGKYVIEAEGIRLAFTNQGAALANLFMKDANGQEIDIALGLDHADLYAETDLNPYLNGIIGRYAGYMSGAGYEADGTKHQVRANAHDGTAIHNGGAGGWGRSNWEVPYHADNSILFVMFDRQRNGFPGLFVGCITHTVTPYEWHISYGVTPLLMPGGPLNMGQQVFFNLDGLGTKNENGTTNSTVLDHKLHLPLSGLRFGVNEQGIPTGDLLSNKKGGEHDFWSEARQIGDGITQNLTAGAVASLYDETFMLSHRHLEDGRSKKEKPAAILSSARSGITMELYTDQDALHVHTWDDKKDGPLKVKHTQGEGDVPNHGAISLEQGDWPNGVNHPEWLNRKTLWGNKDIYTGYVAYKFKVDRKG